jgi:hypothetical protein
MASEGGSGVAISIWQKERIREITDKYAAEIRRVQEERRRR